MMDFSDLSPEEIRQLIADAERVLSEREAVVTARASVDEAVAGYASLLGCTILEAWRDLVPEGIDVPDDPDPITAPEFVQPTGAQDAYNTGDLVTFQGIVYRAIRDAVVWSPLAYPQAWERVT